MRGTFEMKSTDPIAVMCSDLHLSDKCPIARTAEPDWFEAMRRPIKQMRDRAHVLGVPVICAGDIFHKWNSSNELVNFALDELPQMYAVAGQHDLPFHNREDLDRSALGTLVRAGKVKMLSPNKPTLIRGAWLWGFGWGDEVQPGPGATHMAVAVAVIHAYVWRKGKGYEGAPEDARIAAWYDRLKDYQVALFGDNHKGFLTGSAPVVYNHGAFMCRAIDEVNYSPHIGILYRDGNVVQEYLDTAKDLFVERQDELEEDPAFNVEKFVEVLGDLASDSVDFRSYVRRYFQKYQASPAVQRIVLETITEK